MIDKVYFRVLYMALGSVLAAYSPVFVGILCVAAITLSIIKFIVQRDI